MGGNPVRVRRRPSGIASRGVRRDEDRQNRRLVTRLVEVLEIERIVPSLVQVVPVVIDRAALELDREHGRAGDPDRIDSTPEAGDIELQKQRSDAAHQGSLENVDLASPRIALLGLDGALTSACEPAENGVRRHRQELGNRRPVRCWNRHVRSYPCQHRLDLLSHLAAGI